MNNDQLSARRIAERTISSSFFQIGAQGFTIVTGMVRSVILARLLVPEDYGIVALALVFSNFARNTTALGIDSRLVQRESIDQDRLSTHLALSVSLALLAFLILLAATPLINLAYPDQEGIGSVVLAFAALNVLKGFNMTPFVLLKRRLAFRRLALISMTSSLAMLVVAPLLAWHGWGVWALVIGEEVTGTLVSTLWFWTFRRPVRFSLKVSRAMAGDYIGFGKFVMLTHQLRFTLDRFDDFWAGTALGKVALGYYTKAYEFATYPRKVISAPLQDVLFSTYSRLQHDRLNLSKAFFRANSYIVRAGFLFSSTMVLVAPELVQVVLGDQWLPMVSTFQLMVIYSLFDPLLLTAGNLLTACGAPQKMTRIRLAQAGFFIPAVVMGAAQWGIDGIAVAADGMLLVGLLVLFKMTRFYVDISVFKLFRAPILALLGGGVTVAGIAFFLNLSNPLLRVVVKGVGFSVPYLFVLFLLEGKEYIVSLRAVYRLTGVSRFMHRLER